MEKENPLISITVCVRDGIQWVDGCLEALKNQTYRPLEIIAVDDGSTDGSTECLEKWHNQDSDIPIQVLVQEAKGLSSARQLALEHSKGEWIAITDIDVRPARVKTQLPGVVISDSPAATPKVSADDPSVKGKSCVLVLIASKFCTRLSTNSPFTYKFVSLRIALIVATT